MKNLEKRIVDFIKEHHVLTLSTSYENKSYSANCFYSYIEEENWLVFTSDKTTKHISDAQKNSFVSGSIVLETSIIGKIQGIQFNGFMREAIGEEYKKTKSNYLKRFPFAVLKLTSLWIVDLTFIKMTDNRLGFGKKLIWTKE